MADSIDITVPDLGDFSDVEVIEILVAVGDRVAAEDGLITLETDKASMDVPAPVAGEIIELDSEFRISMYTKNLPYRDTAKLLSITETLRSAGLPE